MASLIAAMNPAPNPVGEDGVEQPWLYYTVTDAAGNRQFFDSYDDFLEHKQRAVEEGLHE